ncbi:MAG: bifunctional folylpolyglutamate synthase/dihydrofolate synthase, partial [Chloroflexi bacterium]|nr:bifunctional folylpolyglutamate synthase/dihydrofolate synthase [Chloroflexota bacterium]
GRHQVHNAALAVTAAMALQRFGYRVSEEAVRTGLTGCRIPGRMELIEGAPLVLLDGAHNPEKMAALTAAVEELFSGRRTVWVIAMRRGHDAVATLSALRGLAHAVVCTRFGAVTDWGVEASQPRESLREIVAGWGIPSLVAANAPEALERARELAGEEGLVVVAGSLYLVGEVRTLLRRS